MRVTRQEVPYGDAGIERTLRQMQRLADSARGDVRVIALAHDLVRGLPERRKDLEASTLLDFVRERLRYTDDPWDSKGGKELIKHPAVIVEEITRNGSYVGDCVGDSVVLVRGLVPVHGENADGLPVDTATLVVTPMRLSALASLGDAVGGLGFEVLDHRDEWVPLRAAIEKGRKRVLWITTRRGGSLLVTPDHRVRSNGLWVRAGDLRRGGVIARASAVSVTAVDGGVEDEELGWAYGLICSDGTMGEYKPSPKCGRRGSWSRYAWRVSNNDVGLLLRLGKILKKKFPDVEFDVQQYDSERPGSPTRFHTTKHISHLIVRGRGGSRNEFIRGMVSSCRSDREVVIPDFVFLSRASMRGWLDGFSAGDGTKALPKSQRYEFSLGNPLVAASIPVLLDSLGEEYGFVSEKNGRRAVKCRVYSVAEDQRTGKGSSSERGLDEVVSVIDYGEMSVYDLVALGEFVCGVHRVHNCDDAVMLALALLGAVGIPSWPIVIDQGMGAGYSHVLVAFETSPGERQTFDPIVRGTPVGWFPVGATRVGMMGITGTLLNRRRA